MNFSKKNHELRKTNKINVSKKLLFAFAFLSLGVLYAQQGINYKALIKDGSGNVVANQNITVQFQILKGVGMTNVYQETHLPMTDANGIIIINIGEGSIDSGDYSTIDWASDEHHLNVQIDTGAGLTDMGTTQFMAVPYALSAANAATKIDELSDGKSPVGDSSLFLGVGAGLNDNSTFNGNVGIGFDALKSNTTGIGNTAIGADALLSNISGDWNTANGTNALLSNTSGHYNTAIGADVLFANTGNSNTAIGYLAGGNSTGNGNVFLGKSSGYSETNSNTLYIENTSANADNALIYGEFGTDNTTTGNILRTNSEFQIGNPTSTGFAFPTIDGTTNQILQTNGNGSLSWANENLPSGLEAIDEGNGIGWRLIGREPANYGNIGINATDLSYNSNASTTRGATGARSTAMGEGTTASGDYSTAMGGYTTASHLYSIAMGVTTTASGQRSTAMGSITNASGYASTSMGGATTASGDYSTAMGQSTTASGYISTTMGQSTTASGDYSTAMGRSTTTTSQNSTAIGRYNIGGGNATTWVETDKLFEIGNGVNNANKSNAFTVLKNGTITAPSFDISEITDDKALITKEYAELNFNANSINDLTDGKSPVGDTSLFIGVDAGLNDDGTTNENVGVGLKALINNTTGKRNTAMGYQALYTNIAGEFNTAVGTDALYTSNANYNTAIGRSALYSNTSGRNNTATGYIALKNNTIGDFNTANGRDALSGNTTGSNNTAIGYNAQVPSGTASNQIRIGNTNITSATTQVAWTFPSDIRWKEQVRALPYGLDMVKQLKPVDYMRKNNDAKTRDMGFIAQDVEALLAKIGYKDQGFLTKDNNGYLSIRYNDFIALLTKAIQEQQEIIENQNKEIKYLTSELVENNQENTKQNKNIEQLLKRMQQLETLLK